MRFHELRKGEHRKGRPDTLLGCHSFLSELQGGAVSPGSDPAQSFLSKIQDCYCWGGSCQRQESRAEKGKRSCWAPGPAFLCQQQGHHQATASRSYRQSPLQFSFHTLVSKPKSLQLAILGGAPRSLSLGRRGQLGGNGPPQPGAPALGVVYFSTGCQSNRNNSGCWNPLNTTAQTDPDQWKPDFASWSGPFSPTHLEV